MCIAGREALSSAGPCQDIGTSKYLQEKITYNATTKGGLAGWGQRFLPSIDTPSGLLYDYQLASFYAFISVFYICAASLTLFMCGKYFYIVYVSSSQFVYLGDLWVRDFF